MFLSAEHSLIRSVYLNRRLNNLPNGKLTQKKARGKTYLNVKIKSFKSHPEYNNKFFSVNREPGKSLRRLVEEADSIKEELRHISLKYPDIDKVIADRRKVSSIKRRNEPVKMDRKYFLTLKESEDSNPFPKPDNSIEYDGILMRSKGEVIIAQHLDKLGIERIYEPCVWANRYIYPDFAIYIPEIDKVILIEYMGALSDHKYLPSAGEKFKTLVSFGFVIGRDVILISETENTAADLELLEILINAAIIANTEVVK